MMSGKPPMEYTIIRAAPTAEPGLEVSVVNHYREMAFCGDRWSWLSPEDRPSAQMRTGMLQQLTTTQILRSELGRRLGLSPTSEEFDNLTADSLAAAGIHAQWLQINDELIIASHPTMEVRLVEVASPCCSEPEKRRPKNYENDAITSMQITSPGGAVAAVSLWPAADRSPELTNR